MTLRCLLNLWRFNALPFERHIIYFIQSVTEVIVIRILSQHQDAGKHVNWL
ncbi:type II toxin-antitoxin system RelE/ParE family toxin [Salmonella enterica subsp. enterica]|nr:type II toxin-antitoxin system RelE/ParE family toxin [Salmonella enterica subsp. enterica serovar Corvallis]EBW4800555.1 type II toxin-antitoxin system RelE/ParE family toxin [Salmonella enterica subsp. enterica serovar Corvallis]EBW6506138.1 type II toxin-antitoxin system RelE/ParE family toxin [Salmonella enterica subsp. enterica serovar Corvallis]EBX4886203.1 type II toxin-antitoxin system RelE/ParE family toxin [Salmonella enterica subsp. enterica serovar Corvallis]EBY9767051.1 type II 